MLVLTELPHEVVRWRCFMNQSALKWTNQSAFKQQTHLIISGLGYSLHMVLRIQVVFRFSNPVLPFTLQKGEAMAVADVMPIMSH